MFRSGNPVLAREIFASPSSVASDTMTVQGAVTKTIFAVLLAMGSGGFVWSRYFAGEDVSPFIVGGLLASTIVSLVIWFRGSAGFITTPIYALGEGAFLGAISAYYEVRYPGIVMHSIALTFGTLFMLLFAYKVRLVQATGRFRAGVFAATGAIGLIYLVDLVLRLFGTHVPFIHEAGLVGIGFSLFVVTIAALNLVLDFDFIERAARNGAARQMEWYGAYGLLVTLVWLYLEVLRLLAKLQDNRGRSSRVDA